MHEDYPEGVGTNAFTLMIPLKNPDLHLVYIDNDSILRKYQYQVGKGIGLASKFMHSTDVGKSRQDDAFFCVTLGSDKPEHWEGIKSSAGSQAEFFMHPFKGLGFHNLGKTNTVSNFSVGDGSFERVEYGTEIRFGN